MPPSLINNIFRCPWCVSDPLLQSYHDGEWGRRPCPEERHFEYLMLECAQAGLSWMTMLRRRDAYRAAFTEHGAEKVAAMGEAEMQALLQNPGLIRNRQKIRAAVSNAAAFLQVQREFGSFDAYLLSFFGGRPPVNSVKDDRSVPAATEASQRISRDMKLRGFSFMGPTVTYAHLQAAGIVDDHVNGCFAKAPLPASPPVEESKFMALALAGKALLDAGVRFGVGGSVLLYRHGLAEDFRDIDLVVMKEDGAKADGVLSILGARAEEKPSGIYATSFFRTYEIGGTGVDMMAGLAVRHPGGVYEYAFDEHTVRDHWPVNGVMLPFCPLSDWAFLYGLMPGKERKAELIETHLLAKGKGEASCTAAAGQARTNCM